MATNRVIPMGLFERPGFQDIGSKAVSYFMRAVLSSSTNEAGIGHVGSRSLFGDPASLDELEGRKLIYWTGQGYIIRGMASDWCISRGAELRHPSSIARALSRSPKALADIVREDLGFDPKMKNRSSSATRNTVYQAAAFDAWNAGGGVTHLELAPRDATAITKLEEAGIGMPDFNEAIVNFTAVLDDDRSWWSAKWTLKQFLSTGVDRFLPSNFDAKGYIKGNSAKTAFSEDVPEVVKTRYQALLKKGKDRDVAWSRACFEHKHGKLNQDGSLRVPGE